MREGGGGDEAVFYGHGAALLFQPGEEACPGGRGGGVKVEDVEALDASGRLRGAGKGIAITVKLCLCGIAMKNITISMDDELYRLARIKAAEQSTSISALCKAFIIRLTGSEVAESEFQRLQREEQELRAELRARRISPSTTSAVTNSTSAMRFVDTNVLLYSLDLEPAQPAKAAIAAQVLTCADLVLSVQVRAGVLRPVHPPEPPRRPATRHRRSPDPEVAPFPHPG
jgi:hypothetical protein